MKTILHNFSKIFLKFYEKLDPYKLFDDNGFLNFANIIDCKNEFGKKVTYSQAASLTPINLLNFMVHNNIGNIRSSLTIEKRTTYAIINNYNIDNILTNHIIRTPQAINIEEGLNKLDMCFSKEIPPSYIMRSYLIYVGKKILNESFPPYHKDLKKFSKKFKKIRKES